MAINKVQTSSGEVLIDLTGDTVTASDIVSGKTAHDRSGAKITGTLEQTEMNLKPTLTINPQTVEQSKVPSMYTDESGNYYNGFNKVVVTAVDSGIDSNIKAGNIKSGVDILGVTGTYTAEAKTHAMLVYENGIYYPESGYDGISKVTVNVPTSEPSLQDKTVTANGNYTCDSGYDGLRMVTVNVPEKTLTSKSITANGTYFASGDNADGYSFVMVNVPTGATLQEKTATTNGTVTPDSGYDGLSKVTVNVPTGAQTQERTITANGTYYPSSGYDGFSKVVVSVAGGNAHIEYVGVGANVEDVSGGLAGTVQTNAGQGLISVVSFNDYARTNAEFYPIGDITSTGFGGTGTGLAAIDSADGNAIHAAIFSEGTVRKYRPVVVFKLNGVECEALAGWTWEEISKKVNTQIDENGQVTDASGNLLYDSDGAPVNGSDLPVDGMDYMYG